MTFHNTGIFVSTAVRNSNLNFTRHSKIIFNIILYTRYTWSRDSSVGIATGYGLDDKERWEFESR
jgi:hypothetical protein